MALVWILVGVLIGLLLAWAVEYALDWRYRTRDAELAIRTVEAQQAALAQARAELERLQRPTASTATPDDPPAPAEHT